MNLLGAAYILYQHSKGNVKVDDATLNIAKHIVRKAKKELEGKKLVD